jgi:hypothetical protein
VIDQVLDTLRKLQNPDGGWGASHARHSNTEATSLAIAGLKSVDDLAANQSAVRGASWLAPRQNQDGSWPLNDVTQNGSWSTALAILALTAFPEHRSAALRAAGWLLHQEGSKPGILAELILLVTGKTKVNELNKDLVGWSWVPNSFSWVEPTSYALIALKKVRAALADTEVNERIRQGDAVIYDRMCKGGGWNYGNSKVMDYALWPYPDITAVALIALQDRAQESANQESLQTLRKMAKDVDSGLALCWGAICLNIYGKDNADWKPLIEKRFAKDGFLGETKTLALALMALSGNAGPMRI